MHISPVQRFPRYPAYPPYKNWIRTSLLRVADVRRLHIIGIARSGTTMLHYCLLAYQNVLIHDGETAPCWYPSLRESLRLALNTHSRSKNTMYVTKRQAGWYRQQNLNNIVRWVSAPHCSLLYIVRDPRDVLTSYHAGSSSETYYVDPNAWMMAARAGDYLTSALATSTCLQVVRFEDLVRDPDNLQELLAQKYGLQLRKEIRSLGQLAHNLEVLDVTPGLETALNRLRNLDSTAIGRWRRSDESRRYIKMLLGHPEYGESIRSFLVKYQYLTS